MGAKGHTHGQCVMARGFGPATTKVHCKLYGWKEGGHSASSCVHFTHYVPAVIEKSDTGRGGGAAQPPAASPCLDVRTHKNQT